MIIQNGATMRAGSRPTNVPYLGVTRDWVIWIIYCADIKVWRLQPAILERNGIAVPILITIKCGRRNTCGIRKTLPCSKALP
jgi:hypothetical protein